MYVLCDKKKWPDSVYYRASPIIYRVTFTSCQLYDPKDKIMDENCKSKSGDQFFISSFTISSFKVLF